MNLKTLGEECLSIFDACLAIQPSALAILNRADGWPLLKAGARGNLGKAAELQAM